MDTTLRQRDLTETFGIPKSRVSVSKVEGRLNGDPGEINIDSNLIRYLEYQLEKHRIPKQNVPKVKQFIADHSNVEALPVLNTLLDVYRMLGEVTKKLEAITPK